MKTIVALVAVSIAAAVVVPHAAAQSVRYRRPYDEGYRLNYGFDHDGGGGGCTDYACSGTCYDGHTGSDLGAPFGTTVLAAAGGTVTATNDGCADYGYYGNTCGGRCGNYVRIRHGDGSSSLYCHMRGGSLRVRTGDSVSCGQPIGQSASSGSSTGAHLHFGHTTSGSGSSSDPWAGGCSRSTSLWVDQGGYRGPPSTACSGPSCSPSGESCNNRDDDCDGRTDEDLHRGCGTDVGECVSGTSTCSGGGWGGCAGEVPPRGEECDGRDQDCDGRTDEALVRSCGTDVGECVSGTETCGDARWQACQGAIDPVPERCDALDNDCDGANDDEQICEREEVAWGAPVYGSGSQSDVDGDGRADACAQMASGFGCLVSSPHGFHRVVSGGGDFGTDFWSATTLRMGDVDGDGRSDVCGREGERLVCHLSTGTAFEASVVGPVVTSATSVELVDVDGDGLLDACVRDPAGLTCHVGTGHGFGRTITLPALSDSGGFANVVHHGSIRFGDVDGDGRADVCARDAAGVDCWPSQGDRFGERLRGPRWSDAAGFEALGYWSTLRLADVDGDGLADVCARTPTGFACARSLGRGFGDVLTGPAMAGEAWDRAEGYATIRVGDVDGDGRADVCAREDDAFRCWLFSGHAFDHAIEGPALSGDAGFGEATRFRSIRLADVDGDARADLCARHADGLHCVLSTGYAFDRIWLAGAWDDASGLGRDASAVTIRIGGVDTTTAPRDYRLVGAFGCAAVSARSSPPLVLLLGVALALVARRRTRLTA